MIRTLLPVPSLALRACGIPSLALRACGIFLILSLLCLAAEPAEQGRVEIEVREKSTGKAIPCRIHLKDAVGKPQRAPGLPFWHDHFVCPGTVQLELTPGKYTFEVEHGPEYRPGTGSFTLPEKGSEKLTVELERSVDLAAEGWWAGELHVHRSVADIELLMQAEDLHIAPVITWWNKRNPWAKEQPPAHPLVRFDGNRYYHLLAGEDEREGGALLYFNLNEPLAITGSTCTSARTSTTPAGGRACEPGARSSPTGRSCASRRPASFPAMSSPAPPGRTSAWRSRRD